MKDAGEFVCEAYNEYGEIDTFCRIHVNGKDLTRYNIYIESSPLITIFRFKEIIKLPPLVDLEPKGDYFIISNKQQISRKSVNSM